MISSEDQYPLFRIMPREKRRDGCAETTDRGDLVFRRDLAVRLSGARGDRKAGAADHRYLPAYPVCCTAGALEAPRPRGDTAEADSHLSAGAVRGATPRHPVPLPAF